MDCRASKAHVCPPELCEAICKGIMKRKEHDETNLCALVRLSDEQLEKATQKAGYPQHWLDRQQENQSTNKI